MTDAAPREYADLVAMLEPAARAFSDAVRDIAAACMPEESGPRSWGRGFGLDRNLAWKLYRIAQSSDLAGVLGAFPGPRGIDLAVEGFRGRGADAAAIAAFTASAEALRLRVQDSGMSRDMLASIAAGGLDSDEERKARRRAATAARKAAATIWGIEAAVGISTYLVTPSSRPGWVDLAYLNLLGGLVRWRPGRPWCVYMPLFSFETESGELDGDVTPSDLAALPEAGFDLDATDPLAPLVSAASDPLAVAEISRTEGAPRQLSYRGGVATIGRPVHLAFGEVQPSIGPMDATDPDEIAALNIGTQIPITTSIVQVLLHREVRRDGDPVAVMTAMLDPTGRRRGVDTPVRMPLDAEVSVATRPRSLPKAAAEWTDPYRDLLDRGLAALDTDLGACRCFRLALDNPPLGATISLRWRLHRGRDGG